MRTVTTSAIALSAALFLGLAGASPSFAKGHNQGMSSTTSETPGTQVGSETVTNSHTEGSEQGNRPDGKGPSADNPGADAGGRSNAGARGGADKHATAAAAAAKRV